MNTAPTLSAVSKLIDTMNIARRHADSQRSTMGDAWADELIAWHQNNLVMAVSSYVENIQDQDMRTLCAKNLLRQGGVNL